MSERSGPGIGFDVPTEPRQPPHRTDGAEAAVGEAQALRIEALGAMTAGVTHEFNNLLTIVLSSLEQLRRQNLDARGLELLQRAEWGARQAARVTGQVLSFARGGNHEEQAADLNEAVIGCDKVLTHAAGGGTQVTFDLAPRPLPARLDRSQLELALINLVRNASDAMAGDGRILVRTSGHPTDGLDGRSTVEVAVIDTGPGMADAVIRQATEPFFTTKASGDGTGLGLWMVRRFMEACGGKLVIESEPGEGCTMRLVFPRTADP
jgi:signal transduction histidine kinase